MANENKTKTVANENKTVWVKNSITELVWEVSEQTAKSLLDGKGYEKTIRPQTSEEAEK